MRPGREIDTMIAKHIFHHEVVIKRKVPTEITPSGERPLREYSKEIGAAFDVAKKLNITLIPIEGEKWFALLGEKDGFNSPASFMEYLSKGDFVGAGAAVSDSAPESICLAALTSLSGQKNTPRTVKNTVRFIATNYRIEHYEIILLAGHYLSYFFCSCSRGNTSHQK